MFLRGWVFFLVVAVGVLAGAFLYVQKQPTVYTSSSVVTLTPKGTRPVSAGVVILTAPRYVAYATSPFALRQVANPLGLDPHELQSNVIVTMEAATANITIQATLNDPQDAADVADALAVLVLKRAAADPILAAQVVSTAVTPNGPSGPNRSGILGGGVVAALVAGLVVALLVERFHQRRRAVVARGVAAVGFGAPAGASSAGTLPEPAPAGPTVPPADATTELAVLGDLRGERGRPLPSDETIMLAIDPSIFETAASGRKADKLAADDADAEPADGQDQPMEGQLALDEGPAEQTPSWPSPSTVEPERSRPALVEEPTINVGSALPDEAGEDLDDDGKPASKQSDSGQRGQKPSPTPSRS
jgi:capsular polysaccharide biosynthesis protein